MTLRSLGGGELYGEKLVRLVYVDEAGISNPEHEPYLVVAAIIIHGDAKLNQVRQHLDMIVEHYIPAQHQSDFVFHATELFNGGGKVFNRDEWPLDKRMQIARELADIPKLFDLPIAFSTQRRSDFPQTFQFPENTKKCDRIAISHACGFMACAMEVDMWMRKNTVGENCLMVVEDNDVARRFIRDFQREHQNPSLKESLPPEDQKYFPFRTIQEDPLFQGKRKSSPLQIADFCAYVIKKCVMNDRRYLPFWGILRGQFSRLELAQ